jgi:hypothetical protein
VSDISFLGKGVMKTRWEKDKCKEDRGMKTSCYTPTALTTPLISKLPFHLPVSR